MALYYAVYIAQDVSVQRDYFLISFTGLHANFKCTDPRHGKVVMPEELVQTEVQGELQKKREERDNLHLQHTEREMLRDANIESVALGKAEQERLIREYNQERDEKRRQQQSTDRTNAKTSNSQSASNLPNAKTLNSRKASGSHNPPASSYQGHRVLEHPPVTPSQPPPQITPKPNAHIYDRIADKKLGHHSGSAGNLVRQDSQSNGTSVDVPSNFLQERNSSTVRAVAPHSDNQHQFVMGSRVQFGNPPRYGEIRWMGNVSQVDGLVAGVELVGN